MIESACIQYIAKIKESTKLSLKIYKISLKNLFIVLYFITRLITI